MATLNHPDRITLDAFSDSQLATQMKGAQYNRFTNVLSTPIIGAKGIQLLSANFVNSALQLNDASQLVFWFYKGATASTIRQYGQLYNVRLHPSDFVPYAGFTTYTRNKYFNNGTELAAALNVAASSNGDNQAYNSQWGLGFITFSYDTTTRRMSVESNGSYYIAPAAADDPYVLDMLRGTTAGITRIKMNAANSVNTYASATLQPYVEGISMNPSIGFAMKLASTPLWAGSASQVYGCATSTGIPQATGTAIEADSHPILLSTQNVSVFLDIAVGSGMDSLGRRRGLVCSVPISVAPLHINSFVASSVEKPALSVPNEIYQMSVELMDENGLPFTQPLNYNTQISFSVFY